MRDDQPAAAHEDDGAADDETRLVRDLLAEHVPLTLIADLFAPAAPPSEQLLQTEGLPGEAWWEGTGSPDGTAPDLPGPRPPAPEEGDS